MIKCPRCESLNVALIPAHSVGGGLDSYYECSNCKANEWMGYKFEVVTKTNKPKVSGD
jgi:phage FluMu protein Com